jgi:methyl-accepting chemotaxis protein
MREERKRVWIDSIQTKLFLRVSLYWLIYQITLWNLVFVWRLLREGPGNPLEQYWRFLVDFAPAIIACLALLPVMSWDVVKFAHRVVGPLYRFKKTMQTIAAGEAVPPLRLREGDLLLDMRDDFNRMLESLQKRGVEVLKPAVPASPAPVPEEGRQTA